MHILITWLCINLLHPLAISIYFNNEGRMLGTSDLPELYLPVFIISLLSSIPALIFSYGTIYLIKKLSATKEVKFLIWLITASLLTLLNFAIVFNGFGGGRLNLKDVEIALPGIITTAAVILVRYKYFMNMLNETSTSANNMRNNEEN
jgi:hypothetical protein